MAVDNYSGSNEVERNLLVVDWKMSTPAEIEGLLNKVNMQGQHWDYFNCSAKTFVKNGTVNRYVSYAVAVLYILRHKKKYNNIIIWQQMIGFMLCLLPRFSSTPKIIITTLLYSPGRVKPGSFRLFLLKQALKRADALLYFSEDMANDVKSCYPMHADKIFSTYLPITNNIDKAAAGISTTENKKDNSVFSGGLSDRDFDSVIRAFTGTTTPVSIICTNGQSFKNPELLTPNFTVKRNVSEMEYHKSVLSAAFVVIALKYEHSSCGQLLFTFCMKNSIPIIASSCYGTRDYIINNDNGILVPINDDRAILSAYNKLVTDTIFRERLVQQSKEMSSKMTFDNYLNKINSIIEKIN